MNKEKSILTYVFLASVIITIDQALKRWALISLQNGKDLQITSWFNFSLITNHGVSWGLLNFQSSKGILALTVIISLIIIAFSSYSIIQHLNRHKIYFESIVIGGAISNVIDRINHGCVIDFLDIHLGTWHWPTFNIADMFIVIGIVGILFKMLSKK